MLEKDGVSHPKTNVDQRNKEDGILPFRLSSYHNWMTWWRLHTAAFWSEKQINRLEFILMILKNGKIHLIHCGGVKNTFLSNIIIKTDSFIGSIH